MKKYLSFLALCFTLTAFSQGQKKMMPCITYSQMEQRFKANPESQKKYERTQETLRAQFLESKSGHINGKAAAFQYTVPTVFHVLHLGGFENVSDAACMAALNTVNADFARTGGDANSVAVPFNGLYIDSEIKFMLAKKDPNGNCTNGIVHYYDERTNWDPALTSYTGITWDPTKYLNIIVVKIIGDGSIIGYTWLPGTWGIGAEEDAIVYGAAFLNGLDARSLSHEIGHWLNLNHTFGATNDPELICGDDGLTDTPDTKGTYSCPNSLTGNVCNGGGTNNVENFMDYSSCPKNFTTDQTNVMRTTLASPVSFRDNLSSPANLAFTDINGAGNCAPICEFLALGNTYTICSGSSLSMKDFSYNGTITSYSWAVTSGSIVSPNSSTTQILFQNPGTSIVSLTVSNAQGSSTKSRTVTVLNGAAVVPNMISESFEPDGLPAGWQLGNLNPGSVTWDQTGLSASNGVKSYYIEGSNNPPSHIDYLYMPVINPSAIIDQNDSVFTFKYAYARNSGTHNDKFEIQASVNCGGSWTLLASLSPGTMANGSGGESAAPFIPLPSQWKRYKISEHPNWVNYLSESSVMIRFMFQEAPTGFGNRMYIDEINFTGSTDIGMNELSKSIGFNLFPNPTKSEATIKFNLSDAANMKINVTDVLGKNVLPEMNYNLNPGEQSISINKNNVLSKGIYFVNLSYNGTKMCRKLIVE